MNNYLDLVHVRLWLGNGMRLVLFEIGKKNLSLAATKGDGVTNQ